MSESDGADHAVLEDEEVKMSQIAVAKPERTCLRAPTLIPGTTFFALMAGTWGAFVGLLAASPTTLDDAYEWLRALPIVWELLMWILTLPCAVAYLVYDGASAHWLRVIVVAVIVTVHLSICAPRAPRASEDV